MVCQPLFTARFDGLCRRGGGGGLIGKRAGPGGETFDTVSGFPSKREQSQRSTVMANFPPPSVKNPGLNVSGGPTEKLVSPLPNSATPSFHSRCLPPPSCISLPNQPSSCSSSFAAGGALHANASRISGGGEKKLQIRRSTYFGKIYGQEIPRTLCFTA